MKSGRRRLTISFALVPVVLILVLAAVAVSIGSLQKAPLRDERPQSASVSSRGVDSRSAFLAGCGRTAESAPISIPIWCASTDQTLDNLTWSTWGGATSAAIGDFTDNPCDCAEGAVRAYPVRATLTNPTRVSESVRYSDLTIVFPQSRPAWAPNPTVSFIWTEDGFVTKQVVP